MSRLSWLQKLYWSHLGKPKEDRELFRVLMQHEVASVLEVGVGDCRRMKRVTQLVNLPDDVESLRYIGTDEFEAADTGRHLSLKQAHQVAKALDIRVSLIPGDAEAALPRVAHKMGPSDLVIVNGGLDPANPHVGPVGTWLNRVAHERSLVLVAREAGAALERLELSGLNLTLADAA